MPSAYGSSASKNRSGIFYRLWCHQHMDQAPQKTAAEFSTASDAISIWINRFRKPQRNFRLLLMPAARSGIICCFWCHQHMDQAPQKTAAEFSVVSECHQHMDQAPQKPQRNFLLFLMPSAHRFWTSICTNRASKNRSGIFCIASDAISIWIKHRNICTASE